MTFFHQKRKSSSELWADYSFLTNEMAKFLNERDIELFYELMEQRETLQKLIDENGDTTFCTSLAGQEVLRSIQQMDEKNRFTLQSMVNGRRKTESVSNAYGGVGTNGVGYRMDRQY